MPDISLNLPIASQPNSTEEPKIPTALQQIQAAINDLDGTNLASSLAQALGVNSASTVRRGSTHNGTAQTTTSATYVSMTTPDKVASVVVPTNGLLRIRYRSLVKVSAGTGTIGIFVGGTQVFNESSAALEASFTDTAYTAASSSPTAGVAFQASAVSDITSNIPIRANQGVLEVGIQAGTYDVEVKYKVSGGNTLTAQLRHLFVEAVTD